MVAAGSIGTMPVWQDTDEATRLLCIGALVDRQFAEAAIREFLTEPRRAVPPSPGVEPETVLRACLAARRRRRIRDLALTGLMVVFLLTAGGLLLAWIVVAALWRRFGPQHRRLDRARRTINGFKMLALVVLAVVVGLVVLMATLASVLVALLGQMASALGSLDPSGSGSEPSSLSSLMAVVALLVPLLCSLGMLAVLWLDRYAVWSAVTTRLRRSTFSGAPPAMRSSRDALLWNPGYGMHARNLADMPGDHVNCVVYRGEHPFVGSGPMMKSWSVAIALEPVDKQTPLFPFAAEERSVDARPGTEQPSIVGLHEEVTRQVRELRRDASLSPSRRLLRLQTEGRVFAPARLLARHTDHPAAAAVLGNGRQRPRHQVDRPFLQHAAQEPYEWLRYYAVYVVESWDREIAVSIFVHYGLDDRNLFIECVPCVLPPVTEHYRAADSLSGTSSISATLDALGSWTVLPLTILPRFFSAVRSFNDPYRGSDDPERLGTAASLRELAASAGLQDYAQESDVRRYLQLLQTRIVRAIGMHLESCGLSAVEFMRQAAAPTINGDVNYVNQPEHSVIGGRGHTVNYAGTPGHTYTSGRDRSSDGGHTTR